MNGTGRKLHRLTRGKLMKLAHNLPNLQELLTDYWLNDEGPIPKRLAQRIKNEMAIVFLFALKAQVVMEWDCSVLDGIDPRDYLSWLHSEEFQEWVRSNQPPHLNADAFKKRGNGNVL